MGRLRKTKLVPALLILSCVLVSLPPRQLRADEPDRARPDASGPIDERLSDAREMIKSGDYDHAIDVLKTAIAERRSTLGHLREAYLLLVKTYVFLGNDLKFKPQGREASNLNYKAAREMIAECLRIRELRHTQPEPASEYPPEMISAFAEVRGQVFGSFRVASLEPRNAMVFLGGDTLRALPADSLLGDVDLAIGPHLVVVRAAGFKDVTEEISISPNSTLERSYRLPKRRSRTWYATVATGTIGVVGGLVAVLTHGGGSTPTAQPLPGAPPPPAK